MAAARIILTIAFAASLGTACAQVGVVPRSDYRVVERFPDRVGEIETLGDSFGAVVDLTSGGDPEKVGLIVTVHINLRKAATQEERRVRVRSYLVGVISLRNRVTGRNLGKATLWATGPGLDLTANYTPKTVRKFTEAIREIIH